MAAHVNPNFPLSLHALDNRIHLAHKTVCKEGKFNFEFFFMKIFRNRSNQLIIMFSILISLQFMQIQMKSHKKKIVEEKEFVYHF